ncbi:hypothetical protein SAMN02745126_05751 [Enhydrobacter aerosaccus]|uniref:SpoIIAA-like n=1 Tax=Enhydrobacter aerosaccus TaxID=225324 RepID=A0A1T4T5X3_9HYPH|nr:STAS/SEC14 domain-containing protein [Enhydrobacter aerosaccus]SKA35940.1 hypothetical protein SAMN02745126_05751 [Enhydrobacter aerosaccus]
MPIYMEISRLYRTVTIVARGTITPEEVRAMAKRLADAQVRPFAKILEVAGARTQWTEAQIMQLAELLRPASNEKRGPVAFIVDMGRVGFPQAFARLTQSEGPISLFKSLHEARDWLKQVGQADATALPESERAGTVGVENASPWTDPEREGILIRGERQRGVRVGALNVA